MAGSIFVGGGENIALSSSDMDSVGDGIRDALPPGSDDLYERTFEMWNIGVPYVPLGELTPAEFAVIKRAACSARDKQRGQRGQGPTIVWDLLISKLEADARSRS